MKRASARPPKSASAAVRAKALSIGGVSWSFMLPGTAFNYAAEVGDALSSGVVVAALNWVMRAFPEAPCIVERRNTDGLWQVQDGHALEDILEQPNPFYDGRVMWMATVMDFCFGEAYWQKIRNGAGKVIELWWIPRALIKPIYDDMRWPNVWIHHYEYRIAGQVFELPVTDVVHFRFGIDPRDSRRGFSQLAAIFREVYVDDQAANFTASILRNLGIIGLIFSPKTGGTAIPPGKLDEFKKYVQENFTADKRGQAMAFSQPTDAQVLSYNLQGFNVGPIRDVSEERVCAAIGIPAAVIGFGTGLQQTKVGATMREMIQLAWRGCLMPTQKIMAGELKRSLIGEFQANTSLFRVRFDVAKIHALWEDDQQKAQRVAQMTENSLITVAEARRELGYPADAKHEFYLRKVTVQAIPADKPMTPTVRVTETAGGAGATPPPSSGEEETVVKPPGQGEPDDVGDPVA